MHPRALNARALLLSAGLAGELWQLPLCGVHLVRPFRGEKDTGIPLTDVVQIAGRHAAVEVHTYPEAEHGFNCDQRGSYHQESAEAATSRTLPFILQNMA